MATASIEIDVGAGFVAGRPAQEDALGHTATLRNADNTGVVTWAWTLVFRPKNATTVLATPAAATTTIGPFDQPGSYLVRLAVNGGSGSWLSDPLVDEIVVRVRDTGEAIVIPAVGETTQGQTTQGWAAEEGAGGLPGAMNETLKKLAVAKTLQHVYDASTPPVVVIDPAGGPIILRRLVASLGSTLEIDDGAVTRAVLDNKGRLVLVSVPSAGEYGIDVDAAVSGLGLLRLQDSAAGTSFRVLRSGAIFGVAAGDTYGFDLDAQSPTTALFRVYDSGAASATSFVVGVDGAVVITAPGSTRALDLLADGCVTDLMRLRDTVAGSSLRVLKNGALLLSHPANTANPLVSAVATSLAAGGKLLLLADLATGNKIDIDRSGAATFTSTLGAGEYGLDINILASANGTFFRLCGTPGDTMVVERDGRVAIYPNTSAVLAASANLFYLKLIHAIDVGGTQRGFYLHGAGGFDVGAGRTFEAFAVDTKSGTITGTARHFASRATSQDTPRYTLRYGAGDSPFTGYDHFCAADGVSLGGHWTLTPQWAAGVASYWLAGAPSRYVLIPLHVPPKATITTLVVHIERAGANAVNARIFMLDDTASGVGDQQTQVAAGASTAGGGPVEEDITVVGIAHTVASGAVATQPAYYLIVESGNANDKVYSGRVTYTYEELLLGD